MHKASDMNDYLLAIGLHIGFPGVRYLTGQSGILTLCPV